MLNGLKTAKELIFLTNFEIMEQGQDRKHTPSDKARDADAAKAAALQDLEEAGAQLPGDLLVWLIDSGVI